METGVRQTDFLVVAFGKTRGMKEELSGQGFKWNSLQQVWYYVIHSTRSKCKVQVGIWREVFGASIRFRYFEQSGDSWAERH